MVYTSSVEDVLADIAEIEAMLADLQAEPLPFDPSRLAAAFEAIDQASHTVARLRGEIAAGRITGDKLPAVHIVSGKMRRAVRQIYDHKRIELLREAIGDAPPKMLWVERQTPWGRALDLSVEGVPVSLASVYEQTPHTWDYVSSVPGQRPRFGSGSREYCMERADGSALCGMAEAMWVPMGGSHA